MTICKKHDEIEKMAIKIRNLVEESLKAEDEDIDLIRNILENIDSEAYDIMNSVDEAAKMGQKMEDRLNVYRNGIEEMGFYRDR